MTSRFINAIDQYFGIKASGSTLLRELQGGLATFLAMAYILFVNPDILQNAISGADKSTLMVATALAAAFGSLVMGLWGKLPFALAPGMGLNAFFAFTLCGSMGMTWQQALVCVFVAGVLFVLIGWLGIRTVIIDSIPHSLKMAMTSGIGLFIAFIGFKSAGLIVANEATFVALGDLHSPGPLVCLLALLTMAALMHFKVPGAILLGIAAAALTAVVFQLPVFNGEPFPGLPVNFVTAPQFPETLFALDFSGALHHPDFLVAVLLVLFVDFFDTTGTLFGLGHEAKLIDKKGRLPRADRAFVADGLATTFSALVGTSPTTTYIESATGIRSGGRTGFMAVVVAFLFVLSIAFHPVLVALPSAAVAAALIIVGTTMMSAATKIDWQDITASLPAFLVLTTIPLSFSIAEGISLGIIAYTLLAILSAKSKQLNPVLIGLSIVLGLRWIFLI